jgi:hypothetical protein
MLSSVAERQPKAIRIIAGTMLMAAFVIIALAIIVQYAGGWGVPYFHFTSDRGSPCRNNLTGYTCSPLTLADLEFYADIDLPDDSKIISGSYVATHDYQLDAQVEVPPGSAKQALAALKDTYGACHPNHPSTLDTKGLREVCVLANDDTLARGGELSSRLYAIGTGVRADGTRLIAMTMKSR